MRDDLRRNLQWLEEELLSEEEEPEEEFSDEPEEERDTEFDDLMDRVDELLDEDDASPQTRGFAFSRTRRNPAVDFARTVYADEEPPELVGRPATRAQKKQQAFAQKEAPQKRTDIKGLVVLACLEVLGILAIIGWWLRWLI